MRTIQIDMFEVQLGAGLLLQFRTPQGRVVRILADAGVSTAPGYPADHVHKKLNAAFADFGDSSRRIDLIVGTHYDADHLKGLVPIIEDETIEITEAWLPPVANDEQRPLSGGPPRSEDFLAYQLRDELGEVKLSAYLANKLAVCKVLGSLDRLAENPYESSEEYRDFPPSNDSRFDWLHQFRRHRHEAVQRLADGNEEHADDDIFVPDLLSPNVSSVFHWFTLAFGILLFFTPWMFHFTALHKVSLSAWTTGAAIVCLAAVRIRGSSRWAEWVNATFGFWLIFLSTLPGLAKTPALILWTAGIFFFYLVFTDTWFRPGSPTMRPSVDLTLDNAATHFRERWTFDASLIKDDARSLAFLRKGAAQKAITIHSLAAVVRALRARNIPMACHTIRDGTPRRFVWSSSEARVIPGDQLATDGPEFTLLGPSNGLVGKHWELLPIGHYMALATFDRVPVMSISPSNQLSYVIRIAFADQAILVTGDAGCVDFKAGPRGKFHKRLLDALLPLHVIQVAHHAGRNAEFYNVLGEAGYGAQRNRSWLLLSHATDDPKRPSEIFASFLGQVRSATDQISLLFTSQPQRNNVHGFISLICPPTDTPRDVGDVRLYYDASGWHVEKHLIQM
jgi:SPW repeat